ncbi:hypothetical protein GBA52_023913 [Prunus armeniaca]|nr:hypothetical protein GBA52_023913 [Prunus armeniaca]
MSTASKGLKWPITKLGDDGSEHYRDECFGGERECLRGLREIQRVIEGFKRRERIKSGGNNLTLKGWPLTQYANVRHNMYHKFPQQEQTTKMVHNKKYL